MTAVQILVPTAAILVAGIAAVNLYVNASEKRSQERKQNQKFRDFERRHGPSTMTKGKGWVEMTTKYQSPRK